MALRQFLKTHSHYLTLICGVSLAWLPTIYGHILLADDYPLMKMYQDGFGSYLRAFGIWRMLGHTTPYLSSIFGPYFFGFYALAFHLLAVCCFYKVVVLLLGSTRLALTLALVMGVFPWGFQALMWESSLQVVMATFLFYANIYLLLSLPRQLSALVVCSLLTLIALLTNDYLAFSFSVSGVILWLLDDGLSLGKRLKQHYAGIAPLVGFGVYIILYRVYSAAPVNEIKYRPFNPRSFFSAYYYQYSNLDIFGSLLHQDTRQLIFYQWNVWTMLAALLLAMAFLYFLALAYQRTEAAILQERISKSILLYIVVLMAGASFVYMIAGGFSYDSRKKYPLVPLLLLLAGWLWRRFMPGIKSSPKSRTALVAACALGIATTWTIIGVWKYESDRHRALIDYLTGNSIGGEVNLISEPDLYNVWPTMFRTTGYRFDDEWVVNRELEYRNSPTIIISQSQQALPFCYDSKQHHWERCGAGKQH